MILGLTGSIGMGKTTVSEMLRTHGVPVFCMDSASHKVREGEALPAIQCLIDDIVDEMGFINVPKLRAFAFASPANFEALEKIMLPFVMERLNRFLFEYLDEPLLVLDIPLLFEKGFDKYCNMVAVVSAGPEVQRQRVLERGTMTEKQFEEILHRQLPDDEKRAKAEFVIDTSVTMEETEEQVRKLVQRLQ